jgi:hypothetical protein
VILVSNGTPPKPKHTKKPNPGKSNPPGGPGSPPASPPAKPPSPPAPKPHPTHSSGGPGKG